MPGFGCFVPYGLVFAWCLRGCHSHRSQGILLDVDDEPTSVASPFRNERGEGFPQRGNMSVLAEAIPISSVQLSSAVRMHGRYAMTELSSVEAKSKSNGTSLVRQREYELHFAKHQIGGASQILLTQKIKSTLLVLELLGLGFFGVDRCFMGQTMCGFVKAFTCGGLLVWGFLDYMLIVINSLCKMDEMHMLGYNAAFKDKDDITLAFWLSCLFLLHTLLCGGWCSSKYRQREHRRSTFAMPRTGSEQDADAPPSERHGDAFFENINRS
eukprot:TRINITY_DN29467_c0_g1_i1.p1 TRINITY_DN29467_c0_g1~~TRINITY_DN29467_c0_g1_i1.p1  ORF type:complete len:269 (-),score=46.44 TRINITY_DN29467_c0_g1_i1:87-893(-)